MTEPKNKQCPLCGEYIPIDDKKCKYCGNDFELDEKSSINQNMPEHESNSLEDASVIPDKKMAQKNKKILLKYIWIILITFIVGVIIIFAVLFFINKNTDVTIAPKDKKAAIPSILENKLSENISKAKRLYKDGNIYEAAQLFQDEIDSNNNPTAYYYMGEIYLENSFSKIAISNYKNALKYKKNFYEPLKRLAEIYASQGEDEVALEYATKAMKQNSKDTELLTTIAQIYNNLGEEDKVLSIYKKVVQLNSKAYDANSYLAYYYYDKSEYKEAIQYLKNLLNISYDTQTAYNLAISYANIEYYSKAIEVLDLIIKNDPYEYYNAESAKTRLTDMKEYYKATHKNAVASPKKTTPTKINSPKPALKPKQEPTTYDQEAENALF